MKRLFDVVASGLGLLVLSPLFLIVAVWIKADFPGPVFYLQVRVGRSRFSRFFCKFVLVIERSLTEQLKLLLLNKSEIWSQKVH